mgnify:CR=1 FL=1
MAITNFIPTVWSARLLENLQKVMVYGQTGVVNRDYEGEIRNEGDTVKILSISAVTVDNYTKGQNITFQELSDAAQTLVIEKQKYFAFEVEDIDKAQSRINIVESAMTEAAYALRDAADQYIAGVMVAGVASANQIGTDASPVSLTAGQTGSGNTNVYEAIVNMRVKLDTSNVPNDSRWLIVPPDVYGLLLKDSRFVYNQLAGQVMLNGEVGQIAGFRVLVSNNVPVSSGKYRILAGHPSAVTYAEQINKIEAIRREARFADGIKGLHLYGAKAIRPQGLVRMIATITP